MTKVMVFGTFDHFHPGHAHFFRQAKALGDYLIVVVATDANVHRAKGKEPKYSQLKRLAVIEKQKIVDKAILGSEDMDYLKTIKDEDIDIIGLGYDQDFSKEVLEDELTLSGLGKVQVVRLKPFQPHKYKSSLLK